MPFRLTVLLLALWPHHPLPRASAIDPARCDGGFCILPELCRPVSVNVYDEVHLDFFSSEECHPSNLKCCPYERIVRAPDTEAPEEGEMVCAARNNNGIGRVHGHYGQDKTRAKYGEFPWMAFVYTTRADYEIFLCGAALIQSKVVVTVAHCVENMGAEELHVRLGEWDLEQMIEIYPPQDRTVRRKIVHPQFYSELLLNDIVILFLHEHIQFTEVVGTVCLPPQNSNFDHKWCVYSNWGEDASGRNTSVLKKTKMPIVHSGRCQKLWRKQLHDRNFELHPGFLCAGGDSGKDVCKGDGGSPLVCRIPKSENQYYLVGMMVFGTECGMQGVPGVYVNIPYYRDWIDGEIEKMYHVDIFV